MPKIVKSRDPKRQHALDIFAAAYDDDGYTEEQKQRINLRGRELKAVVKEVLRRLAAEGRVISIADQIEMLIRGGHHTACGLTAVEYRALWPVTVYQPHEYVGRLDLPLVVDLTIKVGQMAKCNCDCNLWIRPSQCVDIVAPPVHPETGVRLTRYVAWVQLTRWLNRSVEEACAQMPEDEVGLVVAEGLHLPGQYEKHLRKYAVDCCGSRYHTVHASCVRWFDKVSPGFDTHGVRSCDSDYSSGSRGVKVVPVTWEKTA